MKNKLMLLILILASLGALGMIHLDEQEPQQGTKTLKVKDKFTFRDLHIRLIRVNENDAKDETDDSAEFVMRTPTTSQDVTIGEFRCEFVDEYQIAVEDIRPADTPGQGEVDIIVRCIPTVSHRALMTFKVKFAARNVSIKWLAEELRENAGIKVVYPPSLLDKRIDIVYEGDLKGLLQYLAEQYRILFKLASLYLYSKEADMTTVYVMEEGFDVFRKMTEQFLTKDDKYSMEQFRDRPGGMLILTAPKETHTKIGELRQQIAEAYASGPRRVADASQSFTFQILLLGTPGMETAAKDPWGHPALSFRDVQELSDTQQEALKAYKLYEYALKGSPPPVMVTPEMQELHKELEELNIAIEELNEQISKVSEKLKTSPEMQELHENLEKLRETLKSLKERKSKLSEQLKKSLGEVTLPQMPPFYQRFEKMPELPYVYRSEGQKEDLIALKTYIDANLRRPQGERKEVYNLARLLQNPEQIPQEIKWLDFDLKALQTFGIKEFTILGSAIAKCSMKNSASVTIGPPDKTFYKIRFDTNELVLPPGVATTELSETQAQIKIEYRIYKMFVGGAKEQSGDVMMESEDIILPLNKAIILGATIGKEQSLIAIIKILAD